MCTGRTHLCVKGGLVGGGYLQGESQSHQGVCKVEDPHPDTDPRGVLGGGDSSVAQWQTHGHEALRRHEHQDQGGNVVGGVCSQDQEKAKGKVQESPHKRHEKQNLAQHHVHRVSQEQVEEHHEARRLQEHGCGAKGPQHHTVHPQTHEARQ